MFLSGGLLFFCAEVAAIPMTWTLPPQAISGCTTGYKERCFFSGAVFGLARAASRSGRGAEKNLRREVGFVGSIGSKEGERRLSATLPTVDKETSNEGVAAIRKVVTA